MPTGYTDTIIEKKLTFNQFALRCSRAFGACVMIRDGSLDDPIPKVFYPSKYHQQKIKNLKSELKKVQGWLVERANKEAASKDMKHRNAVLKTSHKKLIDKRLYEDMLGKVRKWQPPSSEHFGLKKFMIEQIESTIKFDCRDSVGEYISHSDVAAQSGGKEYKKYLIKDIKHSIKYHEKEHKEELKRTKGRNKWVSDLRSSLK